MWRDIYKMYDHFELPRPVAPVLLDKATFDFRLKFLREELTEFRKAHKRGDLAEAADGLVDLVVVAIGTASLMGLPWQALWDEVQRANMSKQRATTPSESKRGTSLDLVKPPGWLPPNIERILLEASGQQRLEGL